MYPLQLTVSTWKQEVTVWQRAGIKCGQLCETFNHVASCLVPKKRKCVVPDPLNEKRLRVTRSIGCVETCESRFCQTDAKSCFRDNADGKRGVRSVALHFLPLKS